MELTSTQRKQIVLQLTEAATLALTQDNRQSWNDAFSHGVRCTLSAMGVSDGDIRSMEREAINAAQTREWLETK